MADLSDIPADQLVARLQELSQQASPQQQQSQQAQAISSQPAAEPQPVIAPQELPAQQSNTPVSISPEIADAQKQEEKLRLAGRALASLPMGLTQSITDHVENHEIPLTHYLMPDDKNISTGDISNSIANVQKDTNTQRQQFDQENPGTMDWLSERATELVPQIAQSAFVGPALKTLQFAKTGAPLAVKAAQYLTNVGAGAGTGAGFAAVQPQTADTADARDAAREDAGKGGALIGGALSALAPVATTAYSAVANRLSPILAAANRLQTVVGTENVPDFVKNIDANQPIADQILGYQPTTAQLAQNPGMAALERGSRSPSSSIAGDIGQMDINNRNAISNTFEGISPARTSVVGPQGPQIGKPGDAADLKAQAAQLMNTANSKTGSKLASVQNEAKAADQNAQQISANQAQNLPPEDTGDISSQLNDKLLAQYKNDRQVKNDLFQNIDPDGTVPIGTGKLKQTLQNSLNGISSQYARDAATPEIADEIMTLPDTISFKQLQEYRPVLSDEIQKARLSGDGLKAKVLGDLKASLESYTGDLASAGNTSYPSSVYVNGMEVIKDPGSSELLTIAKNDPNKAVRILKTEGGTGSTYAWPGTQETHADVAKALNVPYYEGDPDHADLLTLNKGKLNSQNALSGNVSSDFQNITDQNELNRQIVKRFSTPPESLLPDHAAAAARAQNAMDFYANTFAPKWKNGPGQQFAKGVNTYNPIAPETVASKFIRPGNAGASTLRNLNTMAADDPTIQPIIEKYALGDLQQQKGLIDDNGIINPDKIDAWMQKNYQTLKMNPDLAKKIGDMRDAVGTANEASNEMAQHLKARQEIYSTQQKAINDSVLSNLLGKENTSNVVSSALNSDTPTKNVRALLNIAKQDPTGKAMKGLQQATYDHLKDDLTNVQGRATQDAALPLSMAKLDNYLSNPAKTSALRMIIGDDGINRLNASKQGLQLMNTMSNFQGIPGSATSLNVAAEGLTKRMMKGAFDMVTGGQSGLFNMGMLQADKALQGQIGKMMQKAVIDPAFAKTLATYKLPARFVKLNAAIKSGIPQAVIGSQVGQAGQQQ